MVITCAYRYCDPVVQLCKMTFKKVHKLEKKNVWLTMEEISSWCLHPQWLLLHPSHSVRRTQHLLSGSLQLGYTGTKKSWINQISETRSWLCIFQKRTINLGYLMMGFIIVLSNFLNTKKTKESQKLASYFNTQVFCGWVHL